MRFYMGTIWMSRRADLVYNFPCTTSRKSGSSSSHARTTWTKAAATYSVSQAAVAELEAQKRRAKVEQFRAELRGECACARRGDGPPPPATVRAYRHVYGCDACGWPPA
jgi:uncharacterized protein YcbX